MLARSADDGVADRLAGQLLANDVVAREIGRPGLFGVHALTADAYCHQHPRP